MQANVKKIDESKVSEKIEKFRTRVVKLVADNLSTG